MIRPNFIRFISIILGLISGCLLLSHCHSQVTFEYDYQIPNQLDDGLEVRPASEAGLDISHISDAHNEIIAGRYGEIHSLIIYKAGAIILEEYFPGHRYRWDAPGHKDQWVEWDQGMLHSIMSDTKSITAACVGLAIEKGFIQNVHQTIFDYLPDHQLFKTDGRDKITIEHLLTMTSGLAWTEWNAPYSNPKNPIIGIWYSEKDPISFILDQDLKHEPGSHYSYFGGHQIVLGEIIRHATGLPIDSFSKEYLFKPLGIDTVDWSVRFDNGVIESAGGLKMRPRDMLKVGISFLDGSWNNQPIMPTAWIEKSSNAFQGNTSIKVPGTDHGRCGYSYSWWTKEVTVKSKRLQMFWAGGWGGQKIIVIPELQSVMVMTGGNYTSKTRQFRLLTKYLLPALVNSVSPN